MLPINTDQHPDAHRQFRKLRGASLQHCGDARLTDAVPGQAQHQRIDLLARERQRAPQYLWARRTCPGSAAARPATPQLHHPEHLRGEQVAVVRAGCAKTDPRGPAPLRDPSACLVARWPATRHRQESPQQLAHPGRAIRSRCGRTGDGHACCPSAQFRADIRWRAQVGAGSATGTTRQRARAQRLHVRGGATCEPCWWTPSLPLTPPDSTMARLPWVNTDGTKKGRILAPVGHFYFGAVGQHYSGANSQSVN